MEPTRPSPPDFESGVLHSANVGSTMGVKNRCKAHQRSLHRKTPHHIPRTSTPLVKPPPVWLMGSACTTQRVSPVVVTLTASKSTTVSPRKTVIETRTSSSMEGGGEDGPGFDADADASAIPPDLDDAPPEEQDHPAMSEVGTAAGQGVAAVLKVMKEHENDGVYAAWCCDAIAALCAGNGASCCVCTCV